LFFWVPRIRGAINNASSPTWIRLVEEISELDEADEKQIFGESLPPGLRLIH
jgi:hypothetical protein